MEVCAAMPGLADNPECPVKPRILVRAPLELTRGRLIRLGEGINKVVYASDHWVVKRERRPSEIIALICVWKFLRRLDAILPGGLAGRLMERPGKRIRFLRIVFQAIVVPIPRCVWLATQVGSLWKWHSSREASGQILADACLAGTDLIPGRVTFPPTRLKVGGWPGWLLVSEATERVEATLQDRINALARARRFDDIEVWLERFLKLRRSGWQRGVLSLDAHLKNYGVIENRVVLLDAGGLTNDWTDIERRLGLRDELVSPHAQLGLELTLRDRPDISERFDAHWKAAMRPEAIRNYWERDLQTGEGS